MLARNKEGDCGVPLEQPGVAVPSCTRQESMPKLIEVAKINGKTVYKDVNGNLCTDTDGFLYLRALTEKERDELRRSAKGAIR